MENFDSIEQSNNSCEITIEEDGEVVEYDEEVLSMLESTKIEEGVNTSEKRKTGCCYYLDDERDYFSNKLVSMLSSIDINMEISCLINVVTNSCLGIIYAKEVCKNENSLYSIIDNFLRSRHDLLHNLAMKALCLEEMKTDQKFMDLFEFVPSDKSPDRIVVRDNCVTIIETTATLNVLKSYIGKGKIEEGFKSKYSQEIDRLVDNGFKVEYIVLSFDVKDPVNKGYTDDLKKAAAALSIVVNTEFSDKLEIIRQVYCTHSQNITKLFSKEVTNLLSESFTIDKPKLENIDFLIKEGPTSLPNYKRVTVSSFVYNKITAAWPRFPMMLEKTNIEQDVKVCPVLDHSVNKFSFTKSQDGLLYDDLMNILIYDDKPSFCKILKQTYDGKMFLSDRADVEFFDLVQQSSRGNPDLPELIQQKHFNSLPWIEFKEEGDYSDLVQISRYLDLHHKNEDKDYENKLIKEFCNFYESMSDEKKLNDFFNGLGKKPFAKFLIHESVVDDAIKLYEQKMLEINEGTEASKVIRYQKQPFLNPLCDISDSTYMDYRDTPMLGLRVLSMFKKLDYTQQIYNLITRDDFVWGSRQVAESCDIKDLGNEIREVNGQIYKIQCEYMKRMNSTRIPKLKDIPGCETLRNKSSSLQRNLNILRSGGCGKLSQVRINCKGKNSRFKAAFDDEMDHFKQKRSTSYYKGVGILNGLMLDTDFSNLKLSLLSPSGKDCPDDFLHNFVSDDVTLLKQLKTDYMNSYSDKLKYLKSTNLYHSCAFVSRLCHTLAYHSQTSMGKDYVAVDNLGYDNVILMVRGGKKVFKTKKSKLFRLMYPVHGCISHWYKSGSFRTSTDVLSYGGTTYVLTPWHALDEVVMNDGLTFLHRTMAYILLSHEQSIEKSLEKNFFNIMLAFHSRRKTEELLHNLRYVCVNSIATISRLDLMFPELAGFNYDFFQSFIRSSLGRNFKDFSIKLINYNKLDKAPRNYFQSCDLRSLFDKSPIENLEDLTTVIYSTFLMSKSPTNQQLEQVKNLTGMLNTWNLHKSESSDDVEKQYDINNVKLIENDLQSYWDGLFKSDFNFDSSFCVQLGKFSADYMSNIVSESEINNKWLNIVNNNWDEFANTKGLRGMTDDKFFNRKGYYIVYDELLKDDGFLKDVNELLSSSDDEYQKRKKLKSLNKTYKQQLGCKNLKEAIFHVVDKKQRGGSREIFVMDLQTKINQQAIEKFLSFLCSKVPNEAISIPSNKRLQHIHSNVFEKFDKSEMETYNLTLDCRKWAPHSMMNKFIDVILSMSGYLPESFTTHFLIFFSKMFNKKVYTRKIIFDIMSKNERTKGLINRVMVEDPEKKGYFMRMSYSWIMGIFNYMSSFVHVMNQIYASHIIMTVTLKCNGSSSFYHMNAHSDDSGGKMQVRDKLDMQKTFFLYELMLKSCNHLLSDKKCNISKRYFEFLSVLYISNTLLSLITKISGSFMFHPTDSGYTGDVNECYSKCIEMISAGATFDIAYLSMKIMSHLVYKFYFNKNPCPFDYKLPPQLLGVPDCHPIMALIAGSDSDIIRLTHNDGRMFDKFVFLSNVLNRKSDLTLDLIKPISATPKIKLSDELLLHTRTLDLGCMDESLKWVLKNINSKNSALELFKYRLMLEDKKFVASLIDENVTRRISRAYYFRSSPICSTPWGQSTYKGLKNALNLFMADVPVEELDDELKEGIILLREDFSKIGDSNFDLYQLMNHEVYSFINNIGNISYTPDDITLNMKTCKPMHINMQKTSLPTSKNFDPSTLCIWIYYPEYRWLINMGDDYRNKFEQISSFLERHGIDIAKVEINWLYNLLQKMKSKFVKEYFIYSNVPHNVRDISTYKDFLTFLAHNSFKNKVVNGITMPMGSDVTNPLSLIFQKQFNDKLKTILTFINFCFSVSCNFSLFQEISLLKINPEILGCKCNRLYDLICELISIWELDLENYHLTVPHLTSLKKFMDNELHSAPWLKDTYYYSFVKSQKLVGNTWLGKGVLYINCPDIKIELHLSSNKIDKIISNQNKYTFKALTTSYIDSVLLNANLPKIEDTLDKIDYSKWEKVSLGMNSGGALCIDQCRSLKLAFPNFEYKSALVNKSSDPSWAKVTLNKNFSYNMKKEDEIYGSESSTLNVLKIAPEETLSVLTKMYDSIDNRKLIESKGEMFKPYFKMFIGEVADIDLSVTKDQLFDMYQSTRIYSILSELVSLEKITKRSLENRRHIYPGQPGGLLSALIDYKELHEEFQFDSELTLSPEMMSLKSSQPESFMSNLISNLKEKYNLLYTGADKETIKREIMKISQMLDGDSYKSKLLSLLTTWGYIGVMGSLDELSFVKKVENFQGLRLYINNPPYVGLNKQILKKLIDSIVKAASKYNYFNNALEGFPKFICRTIDELKMSFISYFHGYVISVFGNEVKGLASIPSIDLIKLSNSLKLLFNNLDFESELQNLVSDHPMLALIPLNKSTLNELVISLETLTASICIGEKSKISLNFHKKIQNEPGLRQPYTITKDFFDDTSLKFGVKAIFYHGTISHDNFKQLNSHRVVCVNGRRYDMIMSEGSYSDICLPFNKFFYLPNRLKKDIDEDCDELYDLNLELSSTEPDTDSILDSIEDLLDVDYLRKSRVRVRGEMLWAEYSDAKWFYLPNLKCARGKLDQIRNSATTIVIVTNHYISDLVEQDNNKIQLFNKPMFQWKNSSLIDPECMIYYVMDTKPIPIKAWEMFLGATVIDKPSLTVMVNQTACMLVRNERGEVLSLNKYAALEEKMKFLNRLEEKGEDSVDVVDLDIEPEQESGDIFSSLRSQGLDDDFIELIKKHHKNLNMLGSNDFFKMIMDKYINSRKLVDVVKNKTKSTVMDILTNLSDVNKATKIFEVASVFSVGAPSRSEIKNRAMKDKFVRAEINCLGPKLLDLILSGRLAVSQHYKSAFYKQCRALRRWAIAERVDLDKKVFLLDLCQLILNDAYVDDECNNDDLFLMMNEFITEKIIDDDEESSIDDFDFLRTYKKEPNKGRLYYGWDQS